MFPGFRVRAITNGVHAPTWTCPSFARLYQANFPHWQHEPEVLVRADQLADEVVWEAHLSAKRELLDRVEAICGVRLDPELPLLGFARRPGYKRPELLFTDLERLRKIARRWPFQVVMGRQGASVRRRWQAADRAAASGRPAAGRHRSGRVPAELRHGACPLPRLGRRRLAERAVAAARGVGHQRHEGGIQRRPELQRAGWLVDRGVDRRAHRLGDR
jgi:hypothetical protein